MWGNLTRYMNEKYSIVRNKWSRKSINDPIKLTADSVSYDWCYDLHIKCTLKSNTWLTSFSSIKFQLNWTKFPCVLKAGHCHGGVATAKLDNLSALQDAIGLLNGTNLTEHGSYCSLEPFIDSKFDVHIQKIGTNYKAFM